MSNTTPASSQTLADASELRARIGHAADATRDALDQLQACAALPALTGRTLQRLLAEAHRQLLDAHRMATPQAVLGARLLDTISQTEHHTTEQRGA